MYYSPFPGSIGRHDQNVAIPAYFFEGAIDDFRYWNRELSLYDIDFLCNDLITPTGDSTSPESDVLVYPNPAKDILQIKATHNEFEYMLIYNSIGQIVCHGKFEITIHVKKFEPGLYILQLLRKDNGQSEIEKFVKE